MLDELGFPLFKWMLLLYNMAPCVFSTGNSSLPPAYLVYSVSSQKLLFIRSQGKLQLYKVSSCQETKPVPCKMYLYFMMIGFYAGKTLRGSLLLKSGEF